MVILLPKREMSALETSEELSRLPGRSCLDAHRLEEALGQLAHGWTPTFGVLNHSVCSLGLQLTLGVLPAGRRGGGELSLVGITAPLVQGR